MKSCDVAVIGAGAAGLVTARELSREGHSVTVFEQNTVVGGVWKYAETVEDDLVGLDPNRERVHSSLYASVRTNLPREIMSFFDWPFIPDAMRGRSLDPRRFCRHEEVQAYLELFAEEFDILPKIEFQRRVDAVIPLASTPVASGASNDHETRWRVTSTSIAQSSPQDVQEFDAVVCCIGTYFQPNVPDIPGRSSFPGRQIHSHNYRRSDSFRSETVLVVGASFSGDEIARLIARVAHTVYQTARTWPTAEVQQPRGNLHRLPWVTGLTSQGEALFAGGQALKVDSVVYCTGYQYSFPFLEGTGLVSTEAGHVSPLYKHIFAPTAPSLSFVGLLWKSLRFPQFELQGKLVARVLSGRSQLPSKEAMSADVTAFYELLEANHVPIRYAHNQSDAMPENQWAYNDSLAEACGPDVPLLPQWRRQLHSTLTSTIFEKPETFRDEWSEEEKSAFAVAAKACQELLEEYNSNRGRAARPVQTLCLQLELMAQGSCNENDG